MTVRRLRDKELKFGLRDTPPEGWVYIPPILQQNLSFVEEVEKTHYAQCLHTFFEWNRCLPLPILEAINRKHPIFNLGIFLASQDAIVTLPEYVYGGGEFSEGTRLRTALVDIARAWQAAKELGLTPCGDSTSQQFAALFLPPPLWYESCIDVDSLDYPLSSYVDYNDKVSLSN